MLSNDHVIKGKFLSFSERLTTLANRGEWLEALCLGLELDTEVETQLVDLINQYSATTIPWKFKIINTVEFCIEKGFSRLLFNELMDYFIE